MSEPLKGNARSSGYERAALDWYCEPRRAIDALLDVETFDGPIYDPACGIGNIPVACRSRGLVAHGSDIVDRGFGDPGIDFLTMTTQGKFASIICNPPFSLGVEFTLKALELVGGKVCILQRTVWLEGERRYKRLFAKGHLMRIWQFRSRISMPPGASDSPVKGGSVSFAWFVFSRAHQGPYAGGWLP